jgi:hypothetical protein
MSAKNRKKTEKQKNKIFLQKNRKTEKKQKNSAFFSKKTEKFVKLTFFVVLIEVEIHLKIRKYFVVDMRFILKIVK